MFSSLEVLFADELEAARAEERKKGEQAVRETRIMAALAGVRRAMSRNAGMSLEQALAYEEVAFDIGDDVVRRYTHPEAAFTTA